ncbi:MAG: GNAT family N-acetyltransferase [bacterium]|nr:GNAT family N-acetyltransferase [bacterium]
MTITLSSTIAQHFKQELAGHTVAHKVSGSALENPEIRGEVLRGIQTLMKHNVQCLLISGAGSSLDQALGTKLSHPTTNLRVTPKKDIPHIEEAITTIGRIFSEHCERLDIPYEVLPHSVTQAIRLLDGHKETGGIVGMNGNAIHRVLKQGKLAVLPFGGTDSSGNTLNVNADDVAARAAAEVHAKKLIMYTNEEGILMPDANGKLQKINFLDFHQLFHLTRAINADGDFVIDAGMLPKVKAILEALTYGVPQVHVVQAKAKALFEELFTRTGSGTLIEKEPFLILDYPTREKSFNDILQIRAECSELSTPLGVPFLKPLTPEELKRLLPSTLTLRQRDFLVGTVYFDAVSNHADTAYIGGFAVGENHQDSGYGKVLLRSALEQIEEAGFSKAISITASNAVKHMYENLGAKEDSSNWSDVLTSAKQRYGIDQDLVSLYTFDVPTS